MEFSKVEEIVTIVKRDELSEPPIGKRFLEKLINGKFYWLIGFESPVYSNFPFKLAEVPENIAEQFKQPVYPFYILKSHITENPTQFNILTTVQAKTPSFHLPEVVRRARAQQVNLFKQIPTARNVLSINGQQYGIKGFNNSCYIDVTLITLFAFSFKLDSVFELLSHHPNHVSKVIISNDIISVLRNGGLVCHTTVAKLREILAHQFKYQDLLNQQMDVEDFINFILEKVLYVNKFITYSHDSQGTEYIHPIQLSERKKVGKSIFESENPCRTISQLLEESLDVLKLRFKEFPNPFLLLLRMPVCNGVLQNAKYLIPNLFLQVKTENDSQSNYILTALICLKSHHYTCFVRFENEWGFFDSKPTESSVEFVVVPELTDLLCELEKLSHSSIDPLSKIRRDSSNTYLHNLVHHLYICVYTIDQKSKIPRSSNNLLGIASNFFLETLTQRF